MGVQATHIQFLTLLFPSSLERRLILFVFVPLATLSSALHFTAFFNDDDFVDLGDAIRNTANSTLTLLYTAGLVLWGTGGQSSEGMGLGRWYGRLRDLGHISGDDGHCDQLYRGQGGQAALATLDRLDDPVVAELDWFLVVGWSGYVERVKLKIWPRGKRSKGEGKRNAYGRGRRG